MKTFFVIQLTYRYKNNKFKTCVKYIAVSTCNIKICIITSMKLEYVFCFEIKIRGKYI